MALEKWLYDEIESDRDVTEWLQYILDHSQSAAFAGLLISVGLLGDRFGELVNVMVLWSALRRAAIRESGYYADTSKLEDCRAPLFRRFLAGKLREPLIPLRRAEILGREARRKDRAKVVVSGPKATT